MEVRGKPGRHVLFLQGPGGSFFNDLSRELDAAGVRTSRINVCAGDWMLWRRKNAASYRGRFDEWHHYLSKYISNEVVTDIVLFSDSRPYHRVAKQVAERQGINLFAFENGYLRPDWITLELGGVNGNSRFPRTRAGVEDAPAPQVPNYEPMQRPTRLGLYGHDVAFHFANTLLAPLFPRYRRHRQTLPLLELIGWGKKLLTWPAKKRTSLRTIDNILASEKPFFLYALQLEHDFQLIEHSPFTSIRQATQRVIASFAEKAPEDCLLLVKNHPLDNEVVNRRREVMTIAEQRGVSDRVHFVDVGPNPDLLDNARGMITVNSTMGTSGLLHGLPVCVLGKAVYDIDGLTHQLGLDTFWRQPAKPDQVLFRHFRNALIAACQIHGRFVTRSGKKEAAISSCKVILDTHYVCPRSAAQPALDTQSAEADALRTVDSAGLDQSRA